MLRRISFTATLVLLLCVAVPAQTTNDQVNLLLSTLPAGRDPQRYKGYVEPQYKAVVQRSFYLTMRDGVKIAVQLVLPKDLPADKKIPAIMTMTRYWRAKQGGDPNAFLPSHGYATVFIDARGTGASYGVWKAPFSQDEVKDFSEVVNWLVSQPWSNGKVGAIGNSYTGNTALWLASTMSPAVKAVIPRHYEFDLYSETPYPGGLLTDWMVKTWNEGNRQLDTNPGVRLVDEDTIKNSTRKPPVTDPKTSTSTLPRCRRPSATIARSEPRSTNSVCTATAPRSKSRTSPSTIGAAGSTPARPTPSSKLS